MADEFYKTLGVSKEANSVEIKKAYKKLAKKYHPDVNKDSGAESKFKEINEAYSVLGDEKKRSNYDRFGNADAGAGFGGGGFNQGFGFEDFDDIGDLFSSFFGGRGGRTRRSGPQRGSDLEYHMNVEFKDAALGATKNISIEKTVKCKTCKGAGAEKPDDITNCDNCKGTGSVTQRTRTPFGFFQQTTNCPKCHGVGKQIKNPCGSCHGKGIINDEVEIEVKIPEGIRDGMTLKLTGEGEAGIKNGPSGDLYIRIGVKEDDLFIREDEDLYIDAKISFAQAALGDEIEVPTLTKKAKLDIPHGTTSHTKFRLKGQGIKHINRSGKGDLFVRVILETPTKLSKEEKEIYKKQLKTKKKDKGFFKSLFE